MKVLLLITMLFLLPFFSRLSSKKGGENFSTSLNISELLITNNDSTVTSANCYFFASLDFR